MQIGSGTCINGANIQVKSTVTIGDRCHIASGVQITDSNGHQTYRYDRCDEDRAIPIRIGNNVWIGLNSIVLKGTEIGDNSIVSAGSVVKGSFPAYSLISGNPAKLVKVLEKERFS